MKIPLSLRPAQIRWGIVGLVLLVVAVVGAVVVVFRFRTAPGLEGPAGLTEERIAAITGTCYDPAKARYDELQKNAPPTATDGAEFVRGLEQLPFLAAILSERSTAYEDANTKPPGELAAAAKQHALQLADLSLEVAACYERELAQIPELRSAAAELVAELRAERERLATRDFAPAYTTGESTEAVLTLAPKETKQVRLTTLCIDRFAQPPPAGMRYVLGGTVDEVKKPTLCELLRGAAAGGNLAAAQNAVWRLEQQRANPNTPVVTAAADSTGMFAAQQTGSLGVTAEGTGTLTTLDVTFTNFTGQPLTVDTSCAYFVPLSVPDLEGPIPTPPPDWSDPATAERFTREAEEQQLKNLDEIEKTYQQLGIPFPPQLEEQRRELREKLRGSTSPQPQVRGVYSQVFIPGAGDVDPSQLDPLQVVQTGLGPQPLGIVGVRGSAGVRAQRPPRLWDVLKRDRRVEARERLEDVLDRFARDPSREVLEDLWEELNRCIVNDCASGAEIGRIWDQLAARVQQMVDRAVDRVIASTTTETLVDAIDVLRLCRTVRCDPSGATATLDRHFREMLADRQRRGVPPTTEE